MSADFNLLRVDRTRLLVDYAEFRINGIACLIGHGGWFATRSEQATGGREQQHGGADENSEHQQEEPAINRPSRSCQKADALMRAARLAGAVTEYAVHEILAWMCMSK